MTKQVLSILQMKHLEELGMDTIGASMCWSKTPTGREIVINEGLLIGERKYGMCTIPTYTLQDVLDLLPKQIGTEYIYDLCIFPESISYTQFIGGEMNDTMYEIPINGNLIDSAYEMLCWCIKEEHVNTKN